MKFFVSRKFMKKFTGLGALILSAGVAVTLAGCGGCMGCGSGCNKSAKNTTVTSSNWFSDINYKGIQPSFMQDGENFSAEMLTYKVEFTKGENSTYSVDYTNGEYKTQFYGTKYDWKKSGIPENYAVSGVAEESVYYYRTELNIEVQYEYKGQTTEWFADKVVTEAYFRAAGLNLQPVYSKQEVLSHSPERYQANSLQNAWEEVNAVYETYYNYYCTEATVYTTDNLAGGERVAKRYTGLNKAKNSLFDNSSLEIVLRSMPNQADSTITLFNAVAGGRDNFSVDGGSAWFADEEREQISAVLRNANLLAADKTVETVSASVKYSGTLPGTSSTYWYAAVDDANNNTARSTMVRLAMPISYGLGTLVFSLSSVESTLWAG